MSYRIESDFPMMSGLLAKEAFTTMYTDRSSAVATAIEAVEDPKEREVRVVCVEAGEVVWRSTEEDYE